MQKEKNEFDYLVFGNEQEENRRIFIKQSKARQKKKKTFIAEWHKNMNNSSKWCWLYWYSIWIMRPFNENEAEAGMIDANENETIILIGVILRNKWYPPPWTRVPFWEFHLNKTFVDESKLSSRVWFIIIIFCVVYVCRFCSGEWISLLQNSMVFHFFSCANHNHPFNNSFVFRFIVFFFFI